MPYEIVIPAVAIAALVLGGVIAVAARSDRHLRPWATVTAVGVVAMPLAVVLHNLLSSLIDGEEAVSFILALFVAPVLIAIGVIGSSVVLLRERHDLGIGVALGAAGMGIFAAYMLFVLVVTTVLGGNPDWQVATDFAAMTTASLVSIAGALWSVVVLVRGPRTTAA